jgi:hypothetical protein
MRCSGGVGGIRPPRRIEFVDGPTGSHDCCRGIENAKMTEFAAKDIFSASGLSLLGVSNSHVEKDRVQIARNEKPSPLLLYRDKAGSMLTIADGYHRLCAVYKFDEDAMIPCKII